MAGKTAAEVVRKQVRRSTLGTKQAPQVDDFAKLVPESYLDRSGAVFYSGRRAFSQPSDLYLLALNPAGDPEGPHTIMGNIDSVVNRHPDNWSGYRDERWSGKRPGRDRRQRRVLHLFNRIGRDPGEVPTSETVFLRATDWRKLGELEADGYDLLPEANALRVPHGDGGKGLAALDLDMGQVKVRVPVDDTAADLLARVQPNAHAVRDPDDVAVRDHEPIPGDDESGS